MSSSSADAAYRPASSALMGLAFACMLACPAHTSAAEAAIAVTIENDLDEPRGWDTQLRDEPVINVSYTVAHLLAEGRAGEAAQWRVVPVASAGLGTYFTGVGLGAYAELGWNFAPALGRTALREGLNAASNVGVAPVEGWSVAFFGGLAGYGIAHYLPLDGTVFRDSRSVSAEPFIGQGSVGISVRYGGFVLRMSQTFLTRTFETERERAEFGTLSASWHMR